MRRRDFYWSLYDNAEKNQIDNLRTDQVEAVYAALPKNLRAHWWIWRDGFEKWKPFSDFSQLIISLRKTEDHFASPPPFAKDGDTSSLEDDDQTESEVHFGELSSKTESTLGMSRSAEDRTRIHNTISQAPPAKVSSEAKPLEKKPPAVPLQQPSKSPPNLHLNSSGKAEKKSQMKPAEDVAHDHLYYESEQSVELSLDKTGQGDDRNNFRFDKKLEVRIVAGEKVYNNTTVNISLKGMQLLTALPKGLPRYFNIEIRQNDKVIPVVCTEVKNRDGSPSKRVKIEVNDYTSGLLAMLLAG